jgi:hypothetical protein
MVAQTTRSKTSDKGCATRHGARASATSPNPANKTANRDFAPNPSTPKHRLTVGVRE